MRVLTLSIIALLAFHKSGNTAPVEWSTAIGGNGHYYEFVNGFRTWTSAKSAAENRNFLGRPGHLLTVTSVEELDFLKSQFTDRNGNTPIGWLGGFQDLDSFDYVEPAGGWRWITGEAWIFTNWWTAVGFPDNYQGVQHHVRTQPEFFWDDVEGSPRSREPINGYFVEYPLLMVGNIRGDFDANGILDIQDLDLLLGGIRDGRNFVFDLHENNNLDHEDRRVWVEDLFGTYFGDANLDGEFNSGDLVAIFRAGKFENGLPRDTTWSEGDFNGDADFDSSDLVLAFAAGGYEAGPRPDALPVPEPASVVLIIAAIIFLSNRQGKK